MKSVMIDVSPKIGEAVRQNNMVSDAPFYMCLSMFAAACEAIE